MRIGRAVIIPALIALSVAGAGLAGAAAAATVTNAHAPSVNSTVSGTSVQGGIYHHD